jgi:hypothetical protein
VYKTHANQAALTEVTVGLDSGDLLEIRSGIAEGDTVVVRGQNQLSDQVRVNIHRVERNN